MNPKRLLLAAAPAVALLLAAPAALAQWHHPHGWVRPYPHFHGPYGPRFYAAPWYYAPPVYAPPLYAPPLYGPPLYAVPPPVYTYRYDPPPPSPARPPEFYGEPRYSDAPRESGASRARIEPPPKVAAARLERTVLSARELFAFDEARLRGPIGKLDEIAATLKREPQIDKVRITGHTDRIGSEEYNLKLSERRAQAVKDYLVSKGVAPRRLVALGRGMADPVVTCNDQDRAELIKCLEPNRRVEVEEIVIERHVPQG